MSKLSIGIDIGGTFTDIIIQDKSTGLNLKQLKVATTPKNPEQAIITCLKNELSSQELPNIQSLYHATTIATNAFLGQVNLELPKTVLITTKGFRDVLEIGRQRRASLYDFNFTRPTPIIPRKHRFEVEERLDYTGNVLTPLNMKELKEISKKISKIDVSSIAVSLLHSYKNPIHENKIKEFLESEHPDRYITTSFDVSPEHREFERTSTTAINAVLMPLVSKYIKSLNDSFADFDLKAPLFIMQSNGGVSKSDQIQKLPVSIIESGPSAGVVASRFVAEYFDLDKVLSYDMGGTTAKAGTIVDKTISLTSEYEVGGDVHSGRITKGSGYPARFPFIDLAEISAGGGSIAWVDKGNALRVGPISAGSEPGPACYGFNGEDPTITDANLLLGRLNPQGLLDKTFTIYPELAKEAITKKIAKPLQLNPIESALGVIKIANTNMSRILRIVTVERGLDPRNFTLLAFGGAGPLHACALADELEMNRIIVPNIPGLFSAMGLLYTDVKHTYVKSIRTTTNKVDYKAIEEYFKELESKGIKVLAEEGFSEKNVTHQRFVDLRYAGQGFELMIPVTAVDFGKENCTEQLQQLFNDRHKGIYGYIMENEVIELVNIRINSLGEIQKPILAKVSTGTKQPVKETIVEYRQVYFEELNDFKKTPIYHRSKLLAKNVIDGPAIIEQYDTTTVIPSHWTATIDEYGFIQLERK
ncbi:MAG: hydantoinase/oxoprolinase family protein [Candidatus Heimdallarchaeota archaeon]